MADSSPDPGRAALVIGDVQTGIVAAFPSTGSVLRPLAAALRAVREHGVPVVFVRVALRPDRAEVPGRNPNVDWMFRQGEMFQESSAATAVHADIAPAAGEAVLTKRRGSAFHGTDLDAVLRARGVTEVVLAGIATSGVVLATLVDAVDRDYAVTVLRDGCAETEPELHDFLLDRVFPGRGARVVSTQDWIDGLAPVT